MNSRRYGSKRSIGFWMLVALADAAILIGAAGVPVTLAVVAALALIGGCVLAVRTGGLAVRAEGLAARRETPVAKAVARRSA
jgi:hypothetical protein